MKATIVRPGTVFGVGGNHWVTMMVDMMREQKACRIGSNEFSTDKSRISTGYTPVTSFDEAMQELAENPRTRRWCEASKFLLNNNQGSGS